MVSTAISPTNIHEISPSLARSGFRNVAMIVNLQSSLQLNVADGLSIYLSAALNMKSEIISLEQVLSSSNLEQTFYVSLIEMEAPLLSRLGHQDLTALKLLLTKAPGLLWVTNGGGISYDKPNLHLVDGLARVSRTEFHKLIFVTLALEGASSEGEDKISGHLQHIRQVFQQILRQSPEDFEPEYVVRGGNLEIGRVVEASDLNYDILSKTSSYQHAMQDFGHGPPLRLHIGSPGALDSLQFRELIPAQSLAPGELEIKVLAIGVNFLDCLTALGQIDINTLGSECAGVVSRVGPDCEFKQGDAVVALAVDTYQTYTRAPSDCVAKLPYGMTFTEASAIPVVFCTVWIALYDMARLRAKESILIHAGAGGTGQAAIQVARYLGAEIFVTVGSDAKKRLIMDLYGIPEDHVFYSRNTSFARGIMRITRGRGVDVVLNSLSGEGLRASWDCVAPVSVSARILRIVADKPSVGSLP